MKKEDLIKLKEKISKLSDEEKKLRDLYLRKISSGELAEKVGITPANLSILKTNKAKAIRFSTLEKICEVLECKPGDILDYQTK